MNRLNQVKKIRGPRDFRLVRRVLSRRVRLRARRAARSIMSLETIGGKELLHLRAASILRHSVSPTGRHVEESGEPLSSLRSLGWPGKLLSTQRKFEKSLLANLFAFVLPLSRISSKPPSSPPSLFPRSSFPLRSFPLVLSSFGAPLFLPSSRMLMHARSATVLAGPPGPRPRARRPLLHPVLPL